MTISTWLDACLHMEGIPESVYEAVQLLFSMPHVRPPQKTRFPPLWPGLWAAVKIAWAIWFALSSSSHTIPAGLLLPYSRTRVYLEREGQEDDEPLSIREALLEVSWYAACDNWWNTPGS